LFILYDIIDEQGGFFIYWLSKQTLVFMTAMMALIGVIGCVQQNSSATAKPYPRDGYLGTTSANPNQPLSPTYHNLQADIDMMRRVIAQYPEIVHSNIFFNGPVAQVNVQFHSGLMDERANQVKLQLQQALSTHFPRYRVDVNKA
jgi:hypothetical protein